MKISLVLLFASTAGAFMQVQHARRVAGAAAPALQMGWFENPFHGGGSADTGELDEIWEAQQAILRDRQGHDTKPAMKKKYNKKKVQKFEVKASKPPPTQNLKHMDTTYTDENAFQMPKMPWEK